MKKSLGPGFLIINQTHETEKEGTIRAVTRDIQPCVFFTSVDSNESVQPPFKLRNSKCCSVSSFSLIEYSSD